VWCCLRGIVYEGRRMTKAWLLALGMVLTALFSAHFAPRPQESAQLRASVPLEQLFPARFGAWQLEPAAAGLIRPAFEQARQFQMYDQVLERIYVNAAGQRIMLSVAYGRQQSVGLQMHRPEVCYKAGGFKVGDIQTGVLDIKGLSLPVTRLLASMEGRPEPITYWRLLGNEVVADEMQFKLRQLSLGAASAIPDGMLVRVSSIDENSQAAYLVQAEFIRALADVLTPFQRGRVLGQPGQP
jgi:EpsI family protein